MQTDMTTSTDSFLKTARYCSMQRYVVQEAALTSRCGNDGSNMACMHATSCGSKTVTLPFRASGIEAQY